MVETAEVLEFRGVDKAFGRLRALTAFDCKIAAGEFLALIGPKGAGKTAIIKLAIGLDRPDRGTVSLMGGNVRNHPAKARAAVGVVFADSVLEPDQSVHANLRYGAQLYGLRREAAERRMHALLGRFDLDGHERDLVRSLGSLDRRRVEIVRAVLHMPRLLLLNGVTEGLRPSRRAQLQADVQRLCKDERMAVVWATRRPEEGADADRILALHRGGVSFLGSPAELTSREGESDLAAAILKLTGGEVGTDA
jgi:ABC-2 type transport system ATP-binding protein